MRGHKDGDTTGSTFARLPSRTLLSGEEEGIDSPSSFVKSFSPDSLSPPPASTVENEHNSHSLLQYLLPKVPANDASPPPGSCQQGVTDGAGFWPVPRTQCGRLTYSPDCAASFRRLGITNLHCGAHHKARGAGVLHFGGRKEPLVGSQKGQNIWLPQGAQENSLAEESS